MDGRCARPRGRGPARAQAARHPGPGGFRRSRLPFRAVARAGRARRQAGRGGRHGCELGPARPRPRPARRADHRLPAHPRLDPAQARQGLERAPQADVRLATRRSSGRCAGAPTGSSRRGRRSSSGFPPWPGSSQRCALRQLRQAVSDPQVRRQAHPGLHDRLQADPALQRLLAGLRARRRHAGDRPHRAASSPALWSPPTARGTRSTPSSWAPASTSAGSFDRIDLRGRGRAVARRRVVRRDAHPPRHHRRGLPRALPPARPQHRARPQLGRAR